MGADIHMVLERRYNDRWIGVSTFQSVPIHYSDKIVEAVEAAGLYLPRYASWRVTNRNYALFGQLAGVRGEGPGEFTGRGVPDDASELTRMRVEEWGMDGHSHTWCTLREAIPVFAAHICPGDLLGDERAWLSDTLFDVPTDEVDEHRLVMWFDN